jgi:hypothetical protein
MLLIGKLSVLLLLAALPSLGQAIAHGVRVTFSFANTPQSSCEIELTGDSVRVRRDDPFTPRPASPSERDPLEMGRRALTAGERDSAELLMGLARRWKGYKRYACEADDGYGYSLWTDSLLLNCRNCYSCTAGIGMGEARMLEKFGRYTLWLYRMKDEWMK